MFAIAWPWRPGLAGVLAFGLTFLLHTLVVMAWGAPAGLMRLALLPAGLEEASKLALLGFAGGAARWPLLGAAFGLCHALLHLVRPAASLPLGLAAATAAVLLPTALGAIAAAVSRRTGRRLHGFGLALLLNALVALTTSTASLSLARNQGIPLGTAATCAGLALSVLLGVVAWRYSAASRVAPPLAESPKASASSR